MSVSKSLRKNSIWMMGGNVYYAACQWVVLVIIARIGGSDDVGNFSLALAITTPIMMFFNLGMRTILASDIRADHTEAAYVVFRLLTSVAAFLTCLVVALVYRAETSGVIVAVAVSKSIETITDLYYGFRQRNMNLSHISKSLIMRGTVSTILLSVAYFFTDNLTLSVLAYAFSWTLVLFTFDIDYKINISILSRGEFKESSAYFLSNGVPLGLTALMISLGPNIPRYFLQNYEGSEALGIFSTMAYFITLGTVITSALGQSLVPVLSRFHADGQYSLFKKYLSYSLLLVVLMGSVGVALSFFVGELILKLIYGEDFATHARLFPLFAVAATISYVGNILGYATSSARIFAGQAPAFLLTILVSFISSYLLIPQFGIAGAVYSIVLAAVSNCVSASALLYMKLSRRETTKA